MAFKECFAGSKDIVKKCKENYYLVIYPKVTSREDAKFDGITFSVNIDSVAKSVTLTGERCFTLAFDEGNPHTVTVTHRGSGFKGKVKAAGAKGNPTMEEVELSKPWDLVVLVKEKWPDSPEKDFKNAVVKVGADDKTAGEDGKVEAKNQEIVDKCKLKLVVKGLEKKQCKVTIRTELPKSNDGFLGFVEPKEEAQDAKNEIEVAGNKPGSTITVTYIMAVSVITPKLEADPIALVYREDPNIQNQFTSMSELSLGLGDTQHTKADLAEIEAALTFDDKIKCYKVDKKQTEYTSKTAVAYKDLPLKLNVKGQNKEECKLTLELTTKRKETERSWRIDTDKTKGEGKIWIEELELEVWKYREGKDGGDDDKVASAPSTSRTRELHNQNADKDFTGARLAIKKPSEEFWKRGGTAIVLKPEQNLKLYKDNQLSDLADASFKLQQTDFQSSEYKIWVEGAEANMYNVPPWDASTWQPEKEKGIVDLRVCCDAAISIEINTKTETKNLVNGDWVVLKTYAFDDYLDKKTRNKCRENLKAFGVSSLKNVKDDVALAYAGAHKYYEKLSAAHVNKNYGFGGGGPIFDAFIASMNVNGNIVSWSRAGTEWVENHLLDQHGIPLQNTMFDMIRHYIRSILSQNVPYNNYQGTIWCPFGFDLTRGVPGVHAEVLAVNEILRTVPGVEPEDITVATYRLQNSGNGQGYPFVACVNCYGILLGGPKRVRVITG